MTTTSNHLPVGLEPDRSSSFTDPAQILAFARENKQAANAAEVRVLVAAVEWAEHHTVTLDLITGWSETPASHTRPGVDGGDRPLPVAGAGVPPVSEFAVADFAAALNLSTASGRQLIGDALELRHRLLRVWDAVGEGGCPVWKARRIAQATVVLPVEGAGFVDAQLAGIAHTVSLPQLDRLIAEAKARFAPQLLDEEVARAADGRRFDLTLDDPLYEFTGTAHVDGILDVADALDLAAAVSRGAAQLAALGSEESLDVRRALAVGELARQQLALDLDTEGDPSGEGRAVTLHVHVSADAITGPESQTLHLARVEETGTVVTAHQVATWCRAPATTQITVKPVIDLAEKVHVTQYEVPDRIAERTDLRDVHCVFPYVHPTRPPVWQGLRPRPHPPLASGWPDGDRQHRTRVSTAPPAQDPHRLGLHPRRGRHLPVDLAARPEVRARPPRHPRRHPTRLGKGLDCARPPAPGLDCARPAAPATMMRVHTPLPLGGGASGMPDHALATAFAGPVVIWGIHVQHLLGEAGAWSRPTCNPQTSPGIRSSAGPHVERASTRGQG